MHSNRHENNDFNEEQKFVELGDKKIEYYRRTLSVSKQEKEEETLLEQSGTIKKMQPQNINNEENLSTVYPTPEEIEAENDRLSLCVEDDFLLFTKFDHSLFEQGFEPPIQEQSGPVLKKTNTTKAYR